MKPQVSVILPTYNRRQLLPRAVDSVLEQVDVLWQLIIIDDGSTDETPEYLRNLSHEHPNIFIISVDHRGQSACRNIGLLHAEADIVSYLDSDDEYKPDHLAQRWRYLQSHPDVDVLHGGVEIAGPP
ncbi:MAG: glycosyltransferase family 2 protein, partial [Chlorobi bacterium]|nr:glycosyltransferase family 2 protein [Chlorobiota bacterium]